MKTIFIRISFSENAHLMSFVAVQGNLRLLKLKKNGLQIPIVPTVLCLNDHPLQDLQLARILRRSGSAAHVNPP